ncbi:MAG: hypothetical protein AAFV25_04925 [Bacteroidota bacterium]
MFGNLESIEGIDQLPKVLSEDWIEQAMNKLDKSQMTAEQRMHYEMMLAQKGSILQMRQEEKQQIIKETTERVAKETTERVLKKATEEMAKQLKQTGIPNETIQQVTGLTIEEIDRL